MPDRGHIMTDSMLAELERRLRREYDQAVKDMRKKVEEYLQQDEEKRLIQKRLLDNGKITRKEYRDWCFRHRMMGKRWKQMLDTLSKDLDSANKIALRISRKKMADVYALNANYATYQLEHDGKLDTSFTLYNHDTAEYLLEQERDLMPGPSAWKAKEIAANKSMQWNRQKIQSAVLQGVMQGESPYEVAKRLMGVGDMSYNAAVRYARTMTTNAQNAGRYEAYRRAENLGVDLVIEWQATLDGRTRHEHRMMHGQRRKVNEPFEVDGIKIMWPGNEKCGSSTVPQEQIWNCRCTLLSWVKGFEGDTVKSSPKMGDMSFEEWQHEKETKDKKAVNQSLTERRKQRLAEYRQRHTEPDFGSMDKTQLIEYANKNLKTHIDFKGAEENAVRGTVEAVSRFEKSGGHISARIEFGGTRGMYGLYDPKTKIVHLRKNDSFVESLLKENERAILKLGRVQWIDPTYRGMVVHELGHAFDREFGEEISKEISRDKTLLSKAFSISNYAATEPAYGSPRANEAVAENIAAYLAGEAKRKKIDPSILKILEKYFARNR